MEEFLYKVSVIVPVYNVEKYLRKCLDSLVVQTINLDKIEVLLIDDGSTDSSLEICQEYANVYSCFNVFTKENEGVSATRNFGINRAKGKYIMYLDADDMITENTIEKVISFFDSHYDEVDVVTYPEQAYLKDGRKRAPHIRYQILKETGIYNAEQQHYLFQVRLNIATKNKMADNIKFDENLGYHEDQKYCSELLREKMRLGFVNNCEYKYMIHDNSITGENTNPIELFQPTTKYWEELFESFQEEVPGYYQALYLHDLSWKLSQNCLLPYHYHGEKFEKETERLWKLLERVDIDEILKHPSIDNFHRYYFLEKKKNSYITPLITDDSYMLIAKNKQIFLRSRFELIFNKSKICGTKMLIQCTLKSQFFNFHEKPEVYVQENEGKKSAMQLYYSPMSYYKCKTLTNQFWGFYYECDLNRVKNFKFQVKVDGVYFDTYFYMMPTAPFGVCNSIVRNGYCIIREEDEFFIHSVEKQEREKIEQENNCTIQARSKEAYLLRKLSERFKKERIWLYYDCKGVAYDNGYLQFIHDFEKKDKINRYYILNNDLEECKGLFSEKQLTHVVTFGSDLHKELFIRAEKIITAFIEEVNLYPFPASEKKLYMDVMNQEIVYLQHGILHASLPWKYTPEKVEIDKVVVSSQFEIRNFHEKYCFRKEDILPFGMPRFENLNREIKSVNRILFAPSWRMYLIGQCIDTVWELTDDKFVASKYFNEIQKFLTSEELIELLEKNDLYLDFKVHPIFKPYLKHFRINSNRICIADNMVQDAEYCIFITDFSSYVFNFAYLGKPIVYFVPDILEFEAGLNQYRELDIPFEEAFGEFVQTVEDAVRGVERIIKNGLQPENKYRYRIENFFLPISDCTEKIYRYLVNRN